VQALPPGYELVRVLGAGGVGEVVFARQMPIGRLVAVKRLHGYALAAPDASQRFRREAKVLARLDHPAIVRVYDFRCDDETAGAVLVMEYVAGQALCDALADGPLPAADALPVLQDVASALAAAAAAGVVHRDVKPGNVFVLPTGRAKLGDFGLARLVTDAASFRTADGSVSGTPAYFPPETGQGLSEPDARSDAYSFAVMAFEVLTGSLPFHGETDLDLIAAHWSQQPAAPEVLVPGFPLEASEALLGGLAQDPAERLLPLDLVARLAAVPAEQWPQPGRRPKGAGPGGTVRQLRVESVARLPRTGVGGRRRRASLVLCVAAGLALVAAAALLLSRTGSAPPAALQVESVTVTTTPAAGGGRCPAARFAFTAALTTNGAPGVVPVQWTQPDGRLTSPVELHIAAGQRSASAVLSFDVTGAQPLRGVAVLSVLAPVRLVASSAPISFECPVR
jgi:serine/threonine-protein kinase